MPAERSIETPPARSVAAISLKRHLQQGNAHLDAGRLAEAEAAYTHATETDPTSFDAHVALGFARMSANRPVSALSPLQRAVELAPDSHDAHYLFGSTLLALRRPNEALVHLEIATGLCPDLDEAWHDRAKALFDASRIDDAESLARLRLSVSPTAAWWTVLGNVLAHRRRLHDAKSAYETAVTLDPGRAVAHSNLAPVLLSLGDISGAVAAARTALALEPGFGAARSNLLLALSADPRCDAKSYRAEAESYGRLVAAQTTSARAKRARPAAGAPLRIGMVSGDLRTHPVGFFLLPLLEHWHAVEGRPMTVTAYNTDPARDGLTAALRSRFDAWQDVWTLEDDALAARIRADGIDVLIDLSGHTPGHRLPVFARRPAASQATWLGYWASTGVVQIDHVIADSVSLPDALAGSFTERPLRLPITRLCFSARGAALDVPVAPSPCEKGRGFTFGSFQRLAKVGDAVLACWSAVLSRVPEARFRWQSVDFVADAARKEIAGRFERLGIAPGQFELLAATHHHLYLAAHAEVDVLLDSFPHSGATTTCEALWMGTPTLTLPGPTMLSRQGESLLRAVGLDDWVASDANDFVARAEHVAADPAGLAALRSRLRQRVVRSPLMNARRFARDFRAALALIS